MTIGSKPKLLSALTGLMIPVSRFLLRAGISYRDFSEVAKKAFVQTATETYGVRGRPTNVSRVALLTGLTRKEVRQIKATIESEDNQKAESRSLPAEVLHRWYTADKYKNPTTGKPIELPFAGSDLSFEGLVKECMRDIPAGAVRTELKRYGVIQELNNGFLVPLKREVVPVDAEIKLAEGIETGLAPLARTLVFNSDANNVDTARFQRIVSIPFVRRGALPDIEFDMKQMLVKMTEELDDALARYEVPESSIDKQSGFGIGIYYFREGEE